jgi:hypothetical protein
MKNAYAYRLHLATIAVGDSEPAAAPKASSGQDTNIQHPITFRFSIKI